MINAKDSILLWKTHFFLLHKLKDHQQNDSTTVTRKIKQINK